MRSDIELALDVGLLNYVDNETPRHYFVCGHADLGTVLDYAKKIREQTIIELSKRSYDFCGND